MNAAFLDALAQDAFQLFTGSAPPPAKEVNRPDFIRALDQWTSILGVEHVRFNAEALDRYARCTLPRGTRPRAILKPGRTSEVSAVAKIAAERGVELHAISRGKNWGYGDACAPTDGQVIIDLGRMNRILEVNEDLAYAVIEPGVTQGELFKYLRDNGLPLWLDVTGAGPSASIVGNTLARGFGHTPYGDHVMHMCGLEVVLRDGRVIRTGFAKHANARAAHVFPYGNGPWIDGLFTQSNLGIVTRMGIWLMPQPECCEAFAFSVPQDADLPAVIDALRWLRQQNVVRSTVHVANDLRVISAQRQYPWELTQGDTPLPPDIRLKLRHEAGLGAWNVMGGLYGTRTMVHAAKREVRGALGRLATVHFFNEARLKRGAWVARLAGRVTDLSRLERKLASAQSVYRLLCGEPVQDHLSGVFWRTRGELPENPDPTDTGLIWFSPVVPLDSSAIEEVLATAEPIFAQYRFEPLVTISLINERSAVAVFSICFDKESREEGANAQSCKQALSAALAERGYYVYRGA